MINTPDRDDSAERIIALLDLARAASGVPGVGMEIFNGPEPVYVGPADLWSREEVEIWDRAGRRRGRLVAYDQPQRAEVPLAPQEHERLRHAASAVGDLMSVEELLETEQELSSAVSMTQSAVARQEEREARVRAHVHAQLRGRLDRLESALEDARAAGRGPRTELSGAAGRSEALARAGVEAREMGRFLADVDVVRVGMGTPATSVHRLEDLVDEAVAAVADLTAAGRRAESLADVQVVSTRDARVLVSGTEVTRAMGHLLVSALASGREHERADRVEVDVDVRGETCVVSIEDDGSARRGRELRALLSAGPGGTDDPGAGMDVAFVRAVVEAHGGRLWVEDSHLGGAKVCLTLPVAPADDLERLREDADVPSGAAPVASGPAGRDESEDRHSAERHEDEIPDNVRDMFDRR